MKNSGLVAHVATPLLGVSTGLRSFTPIAAVAWAANRGALPLEDTWASWVGRPACVGVLTAAAVGECIADKLPNAPNRTMPVAVAGRVLFAGLVGAIVATALRRPALGGAALGAVGALAGTYGGFNVRKELTVGKGLKDLPVALVEDCVAVGLAAGAIGGLARLSR